MSTQPDRPIDRRAAIAGAAVGLGGIAAAGLAQDGMTTESMRELVVLWTSADPDVAHRVCLMYTHAAKRSGWFPKVRLVIWGPSQRTLVGDKDLRQKIAEMQADGVQLQACIVCARSYGIVEELGAIGFEVIPMGKPLSGFLQDGGTSVLTF